MRTVVIVYLCSVLLLGHGEVLSLALDLLLDYAIWYTDHALHLIVLDSACSSLNGHASSPYG